MYHNALQQFECDSCQTLIPKKQGVVAEDGHHFCDYHCCRDWLDKMEEDRQWQEEFEFTAVRGLD